ncbi:MAG: DUF1648 domain-containing protein [Acidobacteria bacterium]|nr:DUF1648 domain-containing protein [Acidobacteriota bacterium]MCA1637809.1 DUF1648 domain-containing protein [Acidobacteriota bacterium]
MRVSRLILLFLVSVFICQSLYFYSQMPNEMATHFGIDGRANGWMSKQFSLFFDIGLLLLFLGISFGIPRLTEKMGDSFINLPNKNYWLAKDKRNDTFQYFRNRFEWLGVGLLMLLNMISWTIFQANLGENQRLPSVIWLFLFAFVCFVVVWVITLNRKFHKT